MTYYSRVSSPIEQIEEHANVGFAVVLMIPDDVGAPAGDEGRGRVQENIRFLIRPDHQGALPRRFLSPPQPDQLCACPPW